MIAFPSSKINLGLHVIRKRQDGYHDIETVFYPVNVHDAVEVIHSSVEESGEVLKFTSSGEPIPGLADDNLCIKAVHLVKKSQTIPAIELHLHKKIPSGAGLGGGSSDAASTLILLNKKFQLGWGEEKLMKLSLELGSDCPFFILNKPCIARGRGEELESISLDLSKYKILIVVSAIHMSTTKAFSKIRLSEAARPISEIIRQPIETWKKELINDFEQPVFEEFPELGIIKEKLYAGGAIYASMTGSGSSLYGIFARETDFSDPYLNIIEG
jgi:4-diphosphocytidyl-2-C-methyl-D-erythritol kinase